MGWLFKPSYFGPDRRGGKFHVRFFERRKDSDAGTRATLKSKMRDLAAQGLRWVDHFNYFGPDRRTGVFSHFFLERRKEDSAGYPPPLHAALRQLRMRVLDADDPAKREALCERLMATALLADAQGQTQIGDLLMALVRTIENAPTGADPRAELGELLNRAEALLA